MAHSLEPRGGYWGALTPGGRATLIAAGSWLMFAAGTTLLAQYDESGDVFIIWSGMAKAVARAADGKRVVLALRGPGDIIGELANINGGRRSAAVVAVDHVRALRVRRDSFVEFLGDDSAAARALSRTVVERLWEADRDRLAAASMTVGQRLARLLLKIVNRYGVQTPSGMRINHLSQKDLAACVGGGRRTVAREIGEWKERKIISVERRSVTVHDPAALERIAGRHAPPP